MISVNAVDAFVEITKKVFSLKLWLYNFLLGLFAIAVFLVMLLVFAVPVLATYFTLQLSIAAIAIYAVIAVLFIIALFLLSAFINGIQLNFSREYLESGKISFMQAIDRTMPRIWVAAKQQILVAIFFLILALIVFFPVIASVLNILGQLDFSSLAALQASLALLSASLLQQIIPIIIAFILGALVYAVIILILLPILVVLMQVPFFEKVSAIGAIKRAILLGKKNYFKNYGFTILFGIACLVAMILMFVIQTAITVPFGVVNESVSAESMGAGFFLAFIVAMAISFIIQLIVQVGLSAYSGLYSAKLYLIDVESDASLHSGLPVEVREEPAPMVLEKPPTAKPKPAKPQKPISRPKGKK